VSEGGVGFSLLFSQSESSVSAAVKKDESELKLQLAIVHRAVKNFLKLWDEYARVQGSKLKRFHVIDEEFLTDLDVQMRRQVEKLHSKRA
jgi:hypothetical protein